MNRLHPLLTALHRYDKSVSTRNLNRGVTITAPILAYLIETPNGRILFDVGCDYRKLADPVQRAKYYLGPDFPFGPPDMKEEQRMPALLARFGVAPRDVDAVFISHLHFDHGGALYEFAHADIFVHAEELAAARAEADSAYFPDDFAGEYRWNLLTAEKDLAPGVRVVNTPGHTAGHMSLLVSIAGAAPILLAGDAADLEENIEQEIAPGLCWRDDEAMALASIRRLKDVARSEGAELWPNHDLAFYQRRCAPPGGSGRPA